MARLAWLGAAAGAALLSGVPAGAHDEVVEAPKPVLRGGERLHYAASAWKAARFLGCDVGTAILSVETGRDGCGRPFARIVAKASGSALGHSMDATVVTTLDPATGRPTRYEDENRGSSPGAHLLAFSADGIRYFKRKHCNGCCDDRHFVTESRGGFLGIGSREVRVHCRETHCAEPAHREWRLRHEHEADPLAADPLTILYRARALDLRVGGPARTLRVVVGHGVFDVEVRAVRCEKVTVPAGTFDGLKLALVPRPACGTPATARFQGLFGLCGEIELLVDRETRIPLVIRGTVPMGVDVNAEVVLTRIEESPPPCAAVAPVLRGERAPAFRWIRRR